MGAKSLPSSRIVFSCPWYKIFKEKILYPSGKTGDYFVLKRENYFVGIIAIEKDKIVVIKTWRAAIKDWLYQFPMGGIDKNETSLQAAKREFFEETGYRAKKWQKLGKAYVGIGHTDQIGIYYLATGLIKVTGKAKADPHEIIKVSIIKINKLEEMIKKDKFIDGPSLTAWTIYKSKNQSRVA